jgi:hypothetical protein
LKRTVVVRYLPLKTPKKIVEGTIFKVSSELAGAVKRLTAFSTVLLCHPFYYGGVVFHLRELQVAGSGGGQKKHRRGRLCHINDR